MVRPKPAALLVIAHPDDEVFVSGTLCLLHEAGIVTHLVCITDGAGSVSPLLKLSSDPKVKGAIRRYELSLSATMLGVEHVNVLEYDDVPSGRWVDSIPWDNENLVSELTAILETVRPEIIFTHGPAGGYGHSAHKHTFTAVVEAVARTKLSPFVYSICGRLGVRTRLDGYFDDKADVMLDVRQFMGRRVASLTYYQSQKDFFFSDVHKRDISFLIRQVASAVLFFLPPVRRIRPIGSAESFFRQFPVEGLVLQSGPERKGKDFFDRYFPDDPRVTRVGSKP